MLDCFICSGERVCSSGPQSHRDNVHRLTMKCSMCLARGRTYTVPHTAMIKGCDRWHISDIADTMDGHMVSMAVLRRDLVS